MSKGMPSVIKLFIVVAVGLAGIAKAAFVETRPQADGGVVLFKTPDGQVGFSRKNAENYSDELFIF